MSFLDFLSPKAKTEVKNFGDFDIKKIPGVRTDNVVSDEGLGKFFNIGKKISEEVVTPVTDKASGLLDRLSPAAKTVFDRVKAATVEPKFEKPETATEVLQNVPFAVKEVGKEVSQSVLRSLNVIGEKITPKFVDEVKLGTDESETGKRTREFLFGAGETPTDFGELANRELPFEFIQNNPTLASGVGFLIAGLDIIPGGKGTKRGIKFAIEHIDEFVKFTNIDDLVKLIKRMSPGLADDVVLDQAKVLSTLDNHEDVGKELLDMHSLLPVDETFIPRKPAEVVADYKGTVTPIRQTIAQRLGGGIKEIAREFYELPQIFFKKTGLAKDLYDPIRNQRRLATTQKSEVFSEFKDAGLLKDNWSVVRPDRFTISKADDLDITQYYAGRQGRTTPDDIKFDDLSEQSQQFVTIFDDFIAKNKEKFFEVTAKNDSTAGLKEVENFAPLYTKSNLKQGTNSFFDEDFLASQAPFKSTKARKEIVPFDLYETRYTKVATNYINALSDYVHVGDVTPDIKTLINSDVFKDSINQFDYRYITDWFQSITTPKQKNALDKFLAATRKGTALSALGINPSPVLKQSLTHVPVTAFEGAPPKFHSDFAKMFGEVKDGVKVDLDVSKLPSILERKGSIAIADMQGKYGKAVVGAITEFDKFNAKASLNSLLDVTMKKYEPLKLNDETFKNVVLKEAQDKLDLWYGGMTDEQLPRAFRTEAGKLFNMFLQPLTSQLNGFFFQVAKAQGLGDKAVKTAEVLAAATAIAYLEQVISKQDFVWGTKEEMVQDIGVSLAGNIPQLGSVVFPLVTGSDISPSPVFQNLNNARKKAVDKGARQDDPTQAALSIAQLFGLPKQISRSVGGSEILLDEGVSTSKDGKVEFVIDGAFDKFRTFLGGKPGTEEGREWVKNIGEKKEDMSWNIPSVEFFQNSDMWRKVNIFNDDFTDEQKDRALSLISDTARKTLVKWDIAKQNPNITSKKELAKLYRDAEVGSAKKASTAQVRAYQKQVIQIQGDEKPETWVTADEFLEEINADNLPDKEDVSNFASNLKQGLEDGSMTELIAEEYLEKMKDALVTEKAKTILSDKKDMSKSDWISFVATQTKDVQKKIVETLKQEAALD